MKTEWICSWQYIPGHEKHFETYPTQEAARKAMAKVLNDAVDLNGYLHSLRNEEGEDCGSSADFLERFLSDLTIPESEEEIPPHLDIPDHCLLEIHSNEGFRWGYMRRECPSLTVSHVYYGSNSYPFIIDFTYEHPAEITTNRLNSVRIQIDEHINYGTSAYPLMVWAVLREEPQTQEQSIRSIWQQYDTVIDRKAVGHHLQLLQDLGFPVQRSQDGYYRGGEPCDPKAGIQYGTSAYPLMILQVLDGTPQTQQEIIQKVYQRYGTKIDRKAVSRHLNLLKELGFRVEKSQKGYYMK